MNRLTHTSGRLALWTLALIVLLVFWSHRFAHVGARAAEEAAEAGEAVQADVENGSEDSRPASLGALVFKWPETASEWVGLGFYIALLVFSIVALSVALERLMHLRRHLVIPDAFVQQLQEQLRSRRDSAQQLRELSATSPSPIANILRAGLVRAGRPLLEVEKGLEDAAIREMAVMRARHRPLSVIGSVAPLVGLLGTVIGMIFAFQISSQAGLGKAELLAKGIYLALLTTAGGLTIAIPCLLLAARFNALIERFMREIDEVLLETVPSFARMEQGTSSGPVAAAEYAPAGRS